MSLLSYVELCELVHKGVLSNVNPECINAASIDVHLGDEILAECYGDHRLQIVDLSVKPRQSVQRSSHNIKDGYFDMLPMTGALAHTMEKFYLPDNIVAEYYLNSSLARNHLEHLHAGHCFVAGTMVPMLDGTEKRIEEIQVGDYVYSIDPATGTPKPGKVTFSGKTAEVLKTARVTLDNGEVVESTDDHLYLCRNGRYVEAKALKTGDALMPLRRKIQQGYEHIYCPHVTPKGTWRELHGRYEATHRLFAKSGGDLAVHHKNENKLDNRPDNLVSISARDHLVMHSSENARTQERRAKSAKAMKQTITKLWQDKAYVGKMREVASKNMSEVNKRLWGSDEHRQKMRPVQAETLRKNVAKVGQTSIQRAAKLGLIRKAFDKLISVGRSITEQTYLATKPQNAPTIATIEREFGSFSAVKTELGYENHSVVKIEFVEHEKPVPVFDITVDEHHNFALSAGVFVHNCDPGWNDSTLTLELVNLNRYHTLRLRPGQRIGQMLFYRVTEVPEHRSYATIGNYNGDAGVGRVKGS